MNLRPYQTELVNDIRKSILQGHKRVLAVVGCGAGKSVCAGYLAKRSTDKHNNVLFVVHRRELCQQIRKTFSQWDVDFNYCNVGMVQTVCRNIDTVKKPKLLIIDESHHAMSKSYRRIIEAFPDAVVVAFTATPVRLDGQGLGELFNVLVEGVSTKWLIENKYLSPYKYYGVTVCDTTKLHTRHGEYDKQEVEELMNQNYVFGSALDNWKKYAYNQQTIIYCSSIEVSKKTVAKFREAGISAEHLDGNTPKRQRENIDRDFRNGKIKVLSNVDLFGEGYDVPDCNCCILLRPTKSLSLHIQQSMRSMRYKANKVAIILDHVGNYTRHGLPDDVRDWTLDGRKKGEKTTITIRQCPTCFSVFPTSVKVCPICNTELVVQRNGESGAKVIEEILLEEIRERPYIEYTNCKTFDELNAFRKAKKYKLHWAIRKAKELNIAIPGKYFNFMWRNHL